MLKSKDRLKVLYTKELGKRDAVEITKLTKKQIKFSDYSLEEFSFPKDFEKEFPFLIPSRVIDCTSSSGEGLTSRLESFRKRGEILLVLTEKPLTTGCSLPEAIFTPSLHLDMLAPTFTLRKRPSLEA
jgi:hypothetical protein